MDFIFPKLSKHEYWSKIVPLYVPSSNPKVEYDPIKCSISVECLLKQVERAKRRYKDEIFKLVIKTRQIINRQTENVVKEKRYTIKSENKMFFLDLDEQDLKYSSINTHLLHNINKNFFDENEMIRKYNTEVEILKDDFLNVFKAMKNEFERIKPLIAVMTNAIAFEKFLKEGVEYDDGIFEDILRRTTVYNSVYDPHGFSKNRSWPFHMSEFSSLYTPAVLVFRSFEKHGYFYMKENYKVDFCFTTPITKPKIVRRNRNEFEKMGYEVVDKFEDVMLIEGGIKKLEEKLRCIFNTAMKFGHDVVIISGPIFCFKCPPFHVAIVMKELIKKEYNGVFRKIIICVKENENARFSSGLVYEIFDYVFDEIEKNSNGIKKSNDIKNLLESNGPERQAYEIQNNIFTLMTKTVQNFRKKNYPRYLKENVQNNNRRKIDKRRSLSQHSHHSNGSRGREERNENYVKLNNVKRGDYLKSNNLGSKEIKERQEKDYGFVGSTARRFDVNKEQKIFNKREINRDRDRNRNTSKDYGFVSSSSSTKVNDDIREMRSKGTENKFDNGRENGNKNRHHVENVKDDEKRNQNDIIIPHIEKKNIESNVKSGEINAFDMYIVEKETEEKEFWEKKLNREGSDQQENDGSKNDLKKIEINAKKEGEEKHKKIFVGDNVKKNENEKIIISKKFEEKRRIIENKAEMGGVDKIIEKRNFLKGKEQVTRESISKKENELKTNLNIKRKNVTKKEKELKSSLNKIKREPIPKVNNPIKNEVIKSSDNKSIVNIPNSLAENEEALKILENIISPEMKELESLNSNEKYKKQLGLIEKEINELRKCIKKQDYIAKEKDDLVEFFTNCITDKSKELANQGKVVNEKLEKIMSLLKSKN